MPSLKRTSRSARSGCTVRKLYNVIILGIISYLYNIYTIRRAGYACTDYHQVMGASGELAVTMAHSHPEIDLIIMDINLGPGIDGTEAAE